MTETSRVALIADDHDLSRVALAGVLRHKLEFGEVHEAESFDDALATLGRATGIGLALFDLDMPGMAGPETLAAVRDAFPGLRIVVVSGSTRREDVLAALAAGVHGYVPKTLRVDEIARALGTILSGEIYVPTLLAASPAQPSPPRPAARDATRRVSPVLTPRQAEILDLLGQGLANKEIARRLHLASGTVKVHVSLILRALEVSNRAGAAAFAARERGARLG